MRNFLTIPYQEEIIKKTRQSIVLRGARNCGKTRMTIRWAIENMKQGYDVAYVVGITSLYDNTKSLITQELTRQGIEITGGFMGNIHTAYGKIEVMSIHSPAFQRGGRIPHGALTIDDTDMLRKRDLRYLVDNGLSGPLFIAGTRKEEAMETFLNPRVIGDKKLYHEITWKHMLHAGLMTQEELDKFTSEWPDGFFEKAFGPWTITTNKQMKHVLETFDS